VFEINEPWEFNALGVYNYTVPGPLDLFYNFIRSSHNSLPGNVVEVGVFNGRTLLATALLLRQLGSSKIVYAYDSFRGFPDYPTEDNSLFNNKDDLSNFKYPEFSKEVIERVTKLRAIRQLSVGSNTPLSEYNISNSKDFSANNFELLLRKIEFLGLSNIKFIKGFFAETMSEGNQHDGQIMASFFDCDLYESYKIALSFFWENTVKGGMFYLDEYYSLKFPGAKLAVDEFCIDKKGKIINGSGSPNDDFVRNALIKLE
jgi:hypothetical protein